MSPLTVTLTIFAYFIVLFTVSWLAGRKTDNQGFFVGGRKQPWFLVAIATMGSFLSGVTFVSVPGMVAEKSFSYMQMVMGLLSDSLSLLLCSFRCFIRCVSSPSINIWKIALEPALIRREPGFLHLKDAWCIGAAVFSVPHLTTAGL